MEDVDEYLSIINIAETEKIAIDWPELLQSMSSNTSYHKQKNIKSWLQLIEFKRCFEEVDNDCYKVWCATKF